MLGVLFDLDGTLLDLDLDAFLRAYFGGLQRVAADHFPDAPVMAAVSEGTRAMMLEHPGRTNQQAFAERFREVCGVAFADAMPVFDTFYEEEFPAFGAGLGPTPGARRAVETALAMGLPVVVATNPIFPRRAIEHRLAWAGLADLGLDVLTTYEVMHACKPWPAYFQETAGLAGVPAERCLMVGDDHTLDLPAAAVGMRTWYVGDVVHAPTDHRGSLDDLADALPRLVEGT